MKIEITDGNALLCPNCGGDYLHQRSASVFFRETDDSDTGKFVRCTSEKVHEISHIHNPSPRRDGVLIQFECEDCPADPELAIIQHKGATYVEWHSMRTPVQKDI